MEITRSLEFDAGHRLLNHEGPCRFLHGHRYKAEITLASKDRDEIGRVLDFGVIKERIGGWINENWDHNTLLHTDDPLAQWPEEYFGRKLFLTNENPTVEVMAEILYGIVLIKIPGIGSGNIKCTRVRLYETPNCWADYCGENHL